MLRAENITWIKNKKTILNSVSLEIKKGESIGLAGPNGSGKSSLLKMLACLERPTGGKIIFEGLEMPEKIPMEFRRKIAIVFQESLLLNMNVFQNVAVGLKFRKLPKNVIHEKAQYWMEAFGIAHLARQHAFSLSGGEAQRVSLARAFALDPEILFLDEPFSSLDAPTVEDLLSDLKKVFAYTGVTSLVISHNLRDIQRLTQRMLVMLNGEIKAAGTRDEILLNNNDPQVQLFLNQLALSQQC